ncbi:MAG: DUF11 domain-containing protein, partial [Prevotellaceae bacterium]|nr:DUF11 domain-containing protein [Prevotellaceae bacterium]
WVSASLGELFSYKIKVKNEREKSVDSIYLKDILPPGVDTASALIVPKPTSISGSVGTGYTLVWENIVQQSKREALYANDSLEVTLLDLSGTAGNSYTNNATISSSLRESSLRNNADSATAKAESINSSSSRVSFSFAPSADTVYESDEFTLTLKITNVKEQIYELSSALNLPATLEFMGSSSGSYNSNTRSFSWEHTEGLAKDSSVEITLTVRAANATGSVSCSMEVLVHGESAGSKTATVFVKEQPYNLKVEKTASHNVFYGSAPYGNFSYTITVENTRSEALTQVEVIDTLPKNVEPIDGSLAAGTTADGRQIVTFSIPTVAAGERVDVPLACKFVDGLSSYFGEYLNTAYAGIEATEASYTDNSDTAMIAVRRNVNLKAMVELRDLSGATVYPSDHKFKTGEEFSVWAGVLNNGSLPNSSEVTVAITNYDSELFTQINSAAFANISAGSLVNNAPATKQMMYQLRAVNAGAFSFEVNVETTHNSEAVRDTATTHSEVFYGADVRVTIAEVQQTSSYGRLRSYRITVENIGTDTAKEVTFTHVVPAEMDREEIDMYRSTTGEPTPYNETTGLMTHTQPYLTPAGGTLSSFYFIVESKVIAPIVDTYLPVHVKAEAKVKDDKDFNLKNNTNSAEIRVYSSPYDLSVTVAANREEIHNVAGASDEEKEAEYTITVKNQGAIQADSVTVSYSISPQDIVGIDGVASYSDNFDGVIPQLPSGGSISYTRTVKPLSAAAKGKTQHSAVAWGNANFTKEEATAGDTMNNRSSAMLTLYPWLNSWNVMQGFSPNGDGSNDKFIIHDLENELVKNAELTIVNRYGSEVYHHKKYQEAQLGEEAFTGKGLPDGSYFYHLTIEFNDNTSDSRSGYVTIRRSRWK